MEVVTVWLAIDFSKKINGCMNVIPRSHGNGYSDYDRVDPQTHVFGSEIRREIVQNAIRHGGDQVACELEANHASLHDGRMIHGSEANTSAFRRCGYTMRYISTKTKLKAESNAHLPHQIYLARGRDLAGNEYGDPTRSYGELFQDRLAKKKATGSKEH